MDQLWAPWRLDYVSRPDKSEDCFLCAAAATDDDRGRWVVARGETCFCLLNAWPYNNGHMMVAPLEHKADLTDLNDDELLEHMQTVRRCLEALGEVLGPQGFNVGLNLGAAAGAGVPAHLHWHIVPRWHGDTNFMPVVTDTRAVPQSLDALYDLLRPALAD